MKIPLFTLDRLHKKIGKDLKKIVNKVIDSNNYSAGKETEKFEKSLAAYCGVKYCVACNNGTTALIAAVKALEMYENHYHSTPNTFTATSEALFQSSGFKSLCYVDTDNSGNLDITKLNIKDQDIVVPVNLYSNPVDIIKLKKLNLNTKYYTILDNCQGLGCRLNGEDPAKYADITCISFYFTKVICGFSEAGAILTDSENIYNFCKKYIFHGQSEKYLHDIIGINGRISEITSAVLNYKLNKIENYIDERNFLAEIYDSVLSQNDKISFPVICPYDRSSYYAFVIYVKNREFLQNELAKKGIGTGFHYKQSLHLQKAYYDLGYKKGNFPNAEKQFEECISLPMFQGLTEKEVRFVTDSVLDILE